MKQQEITIVNLLDLSAAFDTVDHDLLLTILENCYGMTDSELYLKYGVPQGSCSGANNFVAYCAPIENVVKNTGLDLSGYTDDHSLRKSFNLSKPNVEDDALLTI